MPKPLKVQIPPPSTPEEFENLCEEIAKEYWKDPTAKKIGTQGHTQHGIDIISPLAMESGKTLVIGIQCKKKKLLTNRKLTKNDIKTTIPKAESFEPKLTRLIFATTSSIDPKIQAYANEINIKRNKKNEFLIEIWFWEDLERILQDKCPFIYLDYFKSILPEGGRIALSQDLIKEVLRTTENLVRENHKEKAKGILSVFQSSSLQTKNPEIELIIKRIKVLILILEEHCEEATQLLLEVTQKFTSDIHSWELLFKRYVTDDNLELAEKTLEQMKIIDGDHQLTNNSELTLKLQKDQDIVFPNTELNGTDKENAVAYIIYHLYAHVKGNKEKRDFYLNKQRASTPNASSPIYFDIFYKTEDLFADIKVLTLQKINSILSFIGEKEIELKTKTPLALSQNLNINFQKLRLEILILSNFSPRHRIPSSLREQVIRTICKSYFNPHIQDRIVYLLSLLILDKKELSTLESYLKNNKGQINEELGYLLIAQAILSDKSYQYAESLSDKLSLTKQTIYLNALKSKDKDYLFPIFNTMPGRLLHPLIAAISDRELAIQIINNITGNLDEQIKINLTHLKILYLIQLRKKSSLKETIKEIRFDHQGFLLLDEIAAYAESNELWDIALECLSNMLKFDLPEEDKVEFETRKAISLYKLEDFNGALEHKNTILENIDKLSIKNQKVAVKVLVLSFFRNNDFQNALKILTDTESIVSDEFEFCQYKAEAERFLEKYEDALSTILKGLRNHSHVSQDIFLACYLILNELSNANVIKKIPETKVTNNTFIKISGLDQWFFVGDQNPIDAIKLSAGDDRYSAIWGKAISDDIDWPSDRYQGSSINRKIENIFSDSTYALFRAQEAMSKSAEEGSPFIWAIGYDNPEQWVENIKKFWQETQVRGNEFFENYKAQTLPFSFLVKVEGGIEKAIGKMCAADEGFVHVNDGNPATEDKQIHLANQAIDETSVFIDATSLLFLIESKLYKVVLDNVSEIFYTPSVTAYIRQLAAGYAQSPFQLGRMTFGKNMEIIASDYDHQKEIETRNRLLEALEYFEQHAIKDTGQFLSSKKVDLETDLAKCITDPFAAARARKLNIISEDYFYSFAIKLLSNEEQPFPISSMALVKALCDKEIVSWDSYLGYISYLLNYRCKHVMISPLILQKAIFGNNPSGLAVVQPNKIRKLHLNITLSSQYGVTPEVASNIISKFLILLIQDSSITSTDFDEILAEILVEAFKGRDQNFGNQVLFKCKQAFQGSGLIVAVTERKEKYQILASQVNTYFSDFNPLYESIPLILARASRRMRQ